MKKYYKIVSLECNTCRNDSIGTRKVNIFECENRHSNYGYYVAVTPYAAIRYGYSLFGGDFRLFCIKSNNFIFSHGKTGKVLSYEVVEEMDIKEVIFQKLSDEEISYILEGRNYDIDFVLKNIDILKENTTWQYRVMKCAKISAEDKVRYGFSKSDCKPLFSQINRIK